MVQKRIKPQACFTNTQLKNNNFTASCTEIDSVMYHEQTFNHDITHEIHRAKMCVCVCVCEPTFVTENKEEAHYANKSGYRTDRIAIEVQGVVVSVIVEEGGYGGRVVE